MYYVTLYKVNGLLILKTILIKSLHHIVLSLISSLAEKKRQRIQNLNLVSDPSVRKLASSQCIFKEKYEIETYYTS